MAEKQVKMDLVRTTMMKSCNMLSVKGHTPLLPPLSLPQSVGQPSSTLPGMTGASLSFAAAYSSSTASSELASLSAASLLSGFCCSWHSLCCRLCRFFFLLFFVWKRKKVSVRTVLRIFVLLRALKQYSSEDFAIDLAVVLIKLCVFVR